MRISDWSSDVCSSDLAAMLAIVSGPLLAMGAALFTILLMLSCLTRGRALVVIRAGEIALAERDETVRLLLRDFEDQGADWLWETDAARRVVRASPRFCHAVGLDPIRLNGISFLQLLAGSTWEQGNFSAGLPRLSDTHHNLEAFRILR